MYLIFAELWLLSVMNWCWSFLFFSTVFPQVPLVWWIPKRRRNRWNCVDILSGSWDKCYWSLGAAILDFSVPIQSATFAVFLQVALDCWTEKNTCCRRNFFDVLPVSGDVCRWRPEVPFLEVSIPTWSLIRLPDLRGRRIIFDILSGSWASLKVSLSPSGSH